MTSSLMLLKRKQMTAENGTWSFGNPHNPLGGWEDHYIRPGHTGECHPNYVAHPIGNEYGFLVCVKKKGPDGHEVDRPRCENVAKYNGYHRYSSRLYDVPDPAAPPIQEWNPQRFQDRRTPNQKYLINHDYISRGFTYNGTGIEPVRTPGRRDGPDPRFHEYGYSLTEEPPYKYDITRLEQPYPVWKNERIEIGVDQDTLDQHDRLYRQART